MKKTALILAAALLWVLPAGADEVIRSFRQQIPIANTHKIHLDFPIAELNVDSGPGNQVGLDVKVRCKEKTGRCADRAHELELVFDNSGEVFKIQMKKYPKWHRSRNLKIVAHITVPRDLALSADLGVGEMRIHDVAGDLDVNLGVGHVNVDLPKAAFASVNLDTGIGESSLVAGGRRYESSGLMTREVRWTEGTGHSRVKVDCGVGEIDVVLK